MDQNERMKAIKNARDYWKNQWPDQLDSGVMFHEGQRITRAEFTDLSITKQNETVVEKDGSWYFLDETWNECGPFKTRDEAIVAQTRYVIMELEGQGHQLEIIKDNITSYWSNSTDKRTAEEVLQSIYDYTVEETK